MYHIYNLIRLFRIYSQVKSQYFIIVIIIAQLQQDITIKDNAVLILMANKDQKTSEE